MKRYRTLILAAAALSLVVVAGTGVVAGQSAGLDINETYGGADFDRAYSVTGTSDGGYAVAGATSSYGSGFQDIWLVKTDANGDVEINRTYGGSEFDKAYSVVQTSDGGYAIAGSTSSYGSGSDDMWLVKTDANGNVDINRTYGGSDVDKAESIVQTSDGGYVIAGSKGLVLGEETGDMWLVKTDENGDIVMNETFGGSAEDTASSVVVTPDGDYALAGETNSYGSGNGDMWLVETDTNGNVEMNRTFGGGSFDSANSVAETSDGGYAVVGGTSSYGSGGDDMWLVKTDANGNVEINRTYGGALLDRAESVVQTSDGGYAIAGSTESYSSFAGASDMWLVKTEANGNVEINRTFGGTGVDMAYSVIEASGGGYVLSGYRAVRSINRDMWLVKTEDAGDGTLSSGNPFGDQNNRPIGTSDAADILFDWNQDEEVNGVQYTVSEMADFLFRWNQER